MVSADGIRDHYYAVVPDQKCINKDHYEAMQHARASWAEAVSVERGHDEEDIAPTSEEMASWSEIEEYKEYNIQKGLAEIPGAYRTGFFSDSAGNLQFAAIWECVKKYESLMKIPEK